MSRPSLVRFVLVLALVSLSLAAGPHIVVAQEKPSDASKADSVTVPADEKQPPALRQPRRPAPAPTRTTPRPAPRAPASDEFALEGATRSLGGAGAPSSISPYMIGDFLSSAGQIFLVDTSSGARGALGEIPSAGGSARVKISENNSPIPRDRLFYAFNEFVNAVPVRAQGQVIGTMDVDRHTPGFEKTFWDGLGSIELRTPIAYTQNSQVFLDGDGPAKDTEFGNIAVAAKFLLWEDDECAWAAGVGVNVPTADDVEVLRFGQRRLTLENESVHILPYVGVLWQPTDRVFVQSFLQVDVDANGNPVIDEQLGSLGVLNDSTLLYADVSLGYWLYRNPDARYLTGIAPTVEFHYTTTLQDADIVATGGLLGLGHLDNRFDIAIVTVGSHFWIGPRSVFTIAGGFPLGNRDEQRPFDSEIIAQFNRFF